VGRGDLVAAGEVGDGAGDLEDAVDGAGGEAEAVEGGIEILSGLKPGDELVQP